MHFDINWCYYNNWLNHRNYLKINLPSIQQPHNHGIDLLTSYYHNYQGIIMSMLKSTYTVQRHRELDINDLLLNGNSPIATRLNDNTTDEASLPPNVVTTPPNAINNRATNYTSVDELKVQALKAGLIRIKISREERNDAVIEDYFNQELYEILLIRHSFLNNNAKHRLVLFNPTIEMFLQQYINSSLVIGSQYKRAELLVYYLQHAILNRWSRDKHMRLVMKRHHRHIEQSTPIYLVQIVAKNVMVTSAHGYGLLILEDEQLIEIANGMRLEEWGDIGESNALEFKNQIRGIELVAINVHHTGRQWPQIVSNNTTYISYGYIDQLVTIEGRLEALEYTNSLVISVPRGLILVLKLCGILNYVGLYPRPLPTHRWGDDHSSIYCATDSKNHEGTGVWGAITHINANLLLRIPSYNIQNLKLQCLPSWLGLLDELLVVFVFINGIGLQSNYTHHCSLDLRSDGYNTSHLAIKQYTKTGNSFVNLQLELISTSTSVRYHTILTTSIHANRGDYTVNIHAINYSGDNPLGHEYIYNIKFGSNVRLLGNISIDSNTYTFDNKQKHVNNTSKVVIYCNTPQLDTIKDRAYAGHTPHHQRNETTTNNGNTTVYIRSDTPSTEGNCMNENLYTSTQQHINGTSTIAIHCNTLWLNINKDRAHVNCRIVHGIGTTFSIGETSSHTSGIYHNTYTVISVDGEHINAISRGGCYIILGGTDGYTIGIGRRDDTRQYGSIVKDKSLSNSSYSQDTNYKRTKSGNNVPDTTQQCTNITSIVYQDETHCSIIIQSDMIQDIILNLKSDNNDFEDIILNLKSDNNDFDLRRRTSNDTMDHISDIQQCDHMDGTTGAIGINTIGRLDNEDDQAITARDGERISSSYVMIRTEDKLVYEYNNPARIRIKSFIGNVSYIYSTSASTSSQHTTQQTTPVKHLTIMSIIGRKDVNSTTHLTLHQNLNLDGMNIRQHHTGVDNNGLDNAMPTINEVNNDSINTSDDNVDNIRPSTTSTSKEKEIMNGEVEIVYLHPEASTLATRSTDMRVDNGEGYTSVAINRMNPSDLCILYAVMTSNILWNLTLVIKRKSLRSWGASKIYPDGGHWTNQLTHVTKCQVEWLGSDTGTHSMGYMWKDKRIPYWWLRNGELWTAAFGSFFCAYNCLE